MTPSRVGLLRQSLPLVALLGMCVFPWGMSRAQPLAPESPAPDSGIEDPVVVDVAISLDGPAAIVTLTFSRRVEYRLQESGSRLKLSVTDPIDEASRVDRRLASDLVRRIRFDRTRRGTDVVFYLGRDFDNFSLSELDNPFRVVLLMQSGTAQPAIPMAGRRDPVPDAPGDPEAIPMHPVTPFVPQAPREAPSAPGDVRVIMIDPGHGGDEEGAVSAGGLKEKELVLDIAKRLRERLTPSGYSVFLTRESDQAVDLSTRTALANHMQADLFISIHANASLRTSARGAEAYFLDYGSGAEVSALAGRENAGPAGPGGGIDLVLWDMAQAAHLDRSSLLADLVQEELDDVTGFPSRGLKQAPFRVLVGAAMPAVLVEVGFLSNPEEEGHLSNLEYRDRIAGAMAAAVEHFRTQSLEEAGARTGSLSGGRLPR